MDTVFYDSKEFQKSLKTLSGLEFMSRIASGELPQPPMGQTLGFRVTEVDSGRAVFEGIPRPEHYNPIGSVHGGFASTLLDSAMACAVHTRLDAGVFYTTLEIKVNLVRPVSETTGLLRAVGTVLHCGKRTATAEGRLLDESGKLHAHGTTTCLIFLD